MTLLLRRWTIPALLAIVAVVQIVRARTLDLTPWKGGGFGMFSSVDTLDARFLRVYVETATEVVPVEPPPHMTADVTRVRAMPSQAGLDQLANRLAGLVWLDVRVRAAQLQSSIDQDEFVHGDPEKFAPKSTSKVVALRREQGAASPEAIVPVRAVRLELWRQSFDDEKTQTTANRMYVSEADLMRVDSLSAGNGVAP